MKFFIAAALLILYVWGCAGAKKVIPFAIGVVNLRNYQLNAVTLFNNSINYAFIDNENTFFKMFSMTRTARGSAIVPDFNSQLAVAIVLKPTEKVVSVDINKAELSGENLNIYYTITDTTSWRTYTQTPMALAAVKKSEKIKWVKFYSSGLQEHRIATNF